MKDKMESDELDTGFQIIFDKNTIDHLGIKLYSSFPPVIAELISNAYDAEAEEVRININYQKKEVSVWDNGHGMSHKELNDCFLVIGRNRRIENKSGFSKNNKRKVTGKKGLGKLAVFGIAKTIEVVSVSDGFKNGFSINYDDMKNQNGNDYRPFPLFEFEKSEEANHTIIYIKKITQKTITDIIELSNSISKRFNFFSNDFVVQLTDELEPEKFINVDKKIFFDSLDYEFNWAFPSDFELEIKKDAELQDLVNKEVNGVIYTKKTPLIKADSGFFLYARKRLASNNTFFDERSNDQFNSYVTGFFNVDFIDENNTDDFIGTARQSVLWENNSDTLALRSSLNKLVKIVGQKWRKERADKKHKEILVVVSEDFYNGLSPFETENLKKIQKLMIEHSVAENNSDDIIRILESVKGMYKFESFQTYVTKLEDEKITIENIKKIADDWEQIESKELAKIATGRIFAIEQFEKFIKEDASETKLMQPFLEKFPWILDPRITTFEREKHFKEILAENFPDRELEEKNRRLDFLCNLVNGELIIIELKRPSIKISQKEITQALDYKDFLEKNHKEVIEKGVKTYLISDKYRMDSTTETIAKSLEQSGDLYIKSYSDLLAQAKQYNSEFIAQYELIRSEKANLY